MCIYSGYWVCVDRFDGYFGRMAKDRITVDAPSRDAAQDAIRAAGSWELYYSTDRFRSFGVRDLTALNQ